MKDRRVIIYQRDEKGRSYLDYAREGLRQAQESGDAIKVKSFEYILELIPNRMVKKPVSFKDADGDQLMKD